MLWLDLLWTFQTLKKGDFYQFKLLLHTFTVTCTLPSYSICPEFSRSSLLGLIVVAWSALISTFSSPTQCALVNCECMDQRQSSVGSRVFRSWAELAYYIGMPGRDCQFWKPLRQICWNFWPLCHRQRQEAKTQDYWQIASQSCCKQVNLTLGRKNRQCKHEESKIWVVSERVLGVLTVELTILHVQSEALPFPKETLDS